MIELGVNHVWRAKYEAMHEWADRAVARANPRRRAPDRDRLAVLALAETMIGAPERQRLAEAAALVDSLSDDEVARHLEAPTRLAGTELYLDRYAEGDLHATRASAGAGDRPRESCSSS